MNTRAFNLIARKVEDLIPYDSNARVHNEAQVAQIAASIKEFGFTNPVLIDEQNTIIAGEGRVLAAQKLKLETVPCVVLAGLTEAQKSAYVIADNKLALSADWDLGLLHAELARLADLDFSMNLTGFSEVEVMAFFDHVDNELAVELAGTGATQAGEGASGPQVDWNGMPEFDQPSAGPFRTVYVHLNDQAAVDAFAELIGQRLTDKTKSVWYPKQAKIAATGVVYA
ncbi:MAG: ParB/Srx family N-terminal domain-containing protein [Rubrivivax sp.]|nr:ParB/Srx family N-terminal domain-containing protein [Rubrivivax sp.]